LNITRARRSGGVADQPLKASRLLATGGVHLGLIGQANRCLHFAKGGIENVRTTPAGAGDLFAVDPMFDVPGYGVLQGLRGSPALRRSAFRDL
jgi:hypothetical protein